MFRGIKSRCGWFESRLQRSCLRRNHALARPPHRQRRESSRLTHHQGFTTSNPWALCCAGWMCSASLYCGAPARLCTSRKIFLRARPADAFSHNKERSEWPLRNDGIVSVIVAQLCGQTSAFNWQFTRLALRPARPPLSLRERAATDLADAAQTKTL
jgi:hypothetical protein